MLRSFGKQLKTFCKSISTIYFIALQIHGERSMKIDMSEATIILYGTLIFGVHRGYTMVTPVYGIYTQVSIWYMDE